MKTKLTDNQKKYYNVLLRDLDKATDKNRLQVLTQLVFWLEATMQTQYQSDEFKQWYLGVWEDKVSNLVDLPRLSYMKVDLENGPKESYYYGLVGQYVSLASYFNDTMRKYRGQDYEHAFKFNGNPL